MSIKARLIYILIILFINGYSNSIGNTVIPFITVFLFFIILIPPLSRITKFNLLHEKLFEFVSQESDQASKQTNIKEPTKKTKSNDSISEDIHAENVTEQAPADETDKDKTVKDLIMSAVDGALKEFIANPPDEAYEGTSGYFSWYINLYDSDYERLTDKSGDDFCVNCDIGLLEEVIMNQTGDFSEVESDVKTTFESYLNQSDEQILQKDSSIIDITKSHFEIAVFEVVDDGADVWRYYREQHSLLNCVDSGNDDSSGHRELFFDSEAPAELDYEEHVDGINDPSITTSISRRPAKIFARGYQLKVDQGIWYELYVKNRDDGPMSYEPLDDKELQMKEAIEGAYLGSFLSELKDYGQCTFYVSNKQEVLTLDKFLTCMESVYVNPDDGSEFDQTLFNNNLKFLKITSDIYKKKN